MQYENPFRIAGMSSKAREALLSGMAPVHLEAVECEVQCNLLDDAQVGVGFEMAGWN